MLFKARVFTNFLLAHGEVHIAKCMFLSNWAPFIFQSVFSTTCGTLQKNLSPAAHV